MVLRLEEMINAHGALDGLGRKMTVKAVGIMERR
jgi:hypothetical protein